MRASILHVLFLLVALASVPASAQLPWAQPFHTDNNAFRAADARVTSGTGVRWDTGGLGLPAGNSITMDATHAYVLDYGDNGTTTTADDYARIRQFQLTTGAPGWTSALLAIGQSISFGSTSAPTIDVAGNALYIGSGNAMQKLNLTTGALIWSTAIDAANTTNTVGSYEFLNGAPTVAGGLVFAESYDMSFMGADKQTIAFNASTGAVVWSHADSGQGTGVPLYIADGGTSHVITATYSGARCYNAATGTQVWSSDTAPTSWTTYNSLFAPLVRSGNDVLVASSSFSSATADLFCIDAATGSRKWVATTAPSTNNPPVVMDGRVYVLGGPYGNAQLGCYDLTSGAQVYKITLGGGTFSTFIAGVNGVLYHANGSALKVIRASDGAVIGSLAGPYSGGVTVNEFGGLLVHTATGYAGFNSIGGLRALGPQQAPSAAHTWSYYIE